jgi:hypothetical protein
MSKISSLWLSSLRGNFNSFKGKEKVFFLAFSEIVFWKYKTKRWLAKATKYSC